MSPDYLTRLLQADPFRRIRHIPGQTVTYLQNPKVACTSIELGLWRAHDPSGVPPHPHVRPHLTPDYPYVRGRRDLTGDRLDQFLRSQFFSVVRNPYSRFLSAYLNKILPGHPQIYARFGLSPQTRPDIMTFLSCLADCDPFTVDHHFRPQHLNLLHGFVPLDVLGYFERMASVHEFLQGHGIEIQKRGKNATNATGRLSQFIGPREAEHIRRYYEHDFRLYGYSEDPNIIEAAVTPQVPNDDRSTLTEFLQRRSSSVAV